MPPPNDALAKITPRQLEILNLVAKGLKNQEIAELLGISLSTVKVHIAAVLKSLQVANRTEAVFEYRAALQDRDDQMHALAEVARDVGRPAIAILPFDDRSTDGPSIHLAESLHQDLVRRMSSWRWFPVLAAGTTTAFGSEAADLVRLREMLGAIYAVVGRIQSQNERYRVHVDLVEVATQRVLWSTRHDFAGEQIFEMQDELCRSVVAEIAPALVRADSELARGRTDPEFEAWSLASQALWHVNRATSVESAAARVAVDSSLERDPSLAMAWYAKAAAYYQRVFHQWADSPLEDLMTFHEAAARCLELDPSDSSAQEIFGFSRLVEGRHDEAIQHLERAVDLNPSNAQAYSELGQALALSGRPDEGIAQLEESLRLAPTGDSAWSTEGGIAIAHFMADRHVEAAHWAQRAISRDPDTATMYAIRAAAQAADGEGEAADRTLEDLRRVDPEFDVLRMIKMVRSASPLYADKLAKSFAKAGLPS